MPKGKAARGSSGYVSVKISSDSYSKAQGLLPSFSKQIAEKTGFAAKVSVATVVETALGAYLKNAK